MDVGEKLGPPDGYRFVSTFKYPKRLMFITKFLPGLICISFNLLVSRGIIGGVVLRSLEGFELAMFIVVVYFSIDIVRGLIQRGLCHLLGYEISFYPLLVAFLVPTIAADVGQYQRRRDALWIAIAPVSLFLLLGILLLFKLPELIGSILAFVLIVNILGTAWDIYFIGWLLRRPGGTLLFTENILLLSVFEPVTGGV
ncbi:MAG TPA: metalloprotease family protein [Ktedonobacteraceae bacterium]|nr:metalloprotease family protein [Ktedonobacteraceae bacterium]